MATTTARLFSAEALAMVGVGWPTLLTGADPAAGAEGSITVPGRGYFRFDTFRIRLVASAAAASRRPVLVIDDGGTVLFEVPTTAVITAGQSITCEWVADLGDAISFPGAGLDAAAAPPDLLLPGWRIGTVTANLQAGDDYGAPRLLAWEVPTGPFGGEGRL